MQRGLKIIGQSPVEGINWKEERRKHLSNCGTLKNTSQSTKVHSCTLSL